MWGQAREGWTICSEGGVWQKGVGLGGDLVTARGHTRWLGAASVGSLRAVRHARTPRVILDRSDVEVTKQLKKDLEAQRIETCSPREEVVALARGTVTPLIFFAKLVELWWTIGGTRNWWNLVTTVSSSKRSVGAVGPTSRQLTGSAEPDGDVGEELPAAISSPKAKRDGDSTHSRWPQLEETPRQH